MTNTEVMQKIDSINYYENRYLHSNACNLCVNILNSKNFTEYIKREVKTIYIELKGLKEPWGYYNIKKVPDFILYKSICDCLNIIYELIE